MQCVDAILVPPCSGRTVETMLTAETFKEAVDKKEDTSSRFAVCQPMRAHVVEINGADEQARQTKGCDQNDEDSMENPCYEGFADKVDAAALLQAQSVGIHFDGAKCCIVWQSFFLSSIAAWRNLCGDHHSKLTWSEIDWLNSGVCNAIGAVDTQQKL